MTKCVWLTETITNQKTSEMSGLKRAFPFSDEDVPYTSLPDFTSVKRPCLPSKCSNTSQTGMKQSGISPCDHTEMDYDNYPGNLCKNGTWTYPAMQNGDISCLEVTNNNSTSNLCTRCQAGEPGHFGHIGR